MALIAQHEREAISKRTREALQAGKRRAVRCWATPTVQTHYAEPNKGNRASLRAIKAKADQQALRPAIEALEEEGVNSLGCHRRGTERTRHADPAWCSVVQDLGKQFCWRGWLEIALAAVKAKAAASAAA